MIIGTNILLRTFRENDVTPFFELDQHIEDRGNYYPREITTENQLKKWFFDTSLWNDDFGRMLIIDKSSQEMLGYINYFKTTGYYDALEIGYLLFNPSQRGKGVMSEALLLFSDHLFKWKKVNRLELRIHPDNIGSNRVAEKCGYVFEGVNRKAIQRFDGYADMKIYSLLRDEFYS